MDVLERGDCLRLRRSSPPWSTHRGCFGKPYSFPNLDICTNEVPVRVSERAASPVAKRKPFRAAHRRSRSCLLLPESSFQCSGFSGVFRSGFLLFRAVKIAELEWGPYCGMASALSVAWSCSARANVVMLNVFSPWETQVKSLSTFFRGYIAALIC